YIKSKINSIWSYVKKITGGLDTRNIGESVVLSFPYFWVGGGKVRKIFLYQKNILFANKKDSFLSEHLKNVRF
ncbi:hypothetical protein, partial [Leptospira interrogans]|uniref:hypothetical protein n=2 Tax=Leptospira interrogans TaxID=173 RepID=UPI000AC82870